MNVNMADIYDDKGRVSSLFAESISGHKHSFHLTNGLMLIHQEICCSTDVTFVEAAYSGIYFSLQSNQKIQSASDFTSLKMTYLEKDISGNFIIKAGETRSLLQLHFDPLLLSQLLNEPCEVVEQHLTMLISKLATNKQTIEMPITQQLVQATKPLVKASLDKRLSLSGQAYAFAFLVLEQMQMQSHMLSCSDCQSKLFSVQNLLEADFGVTKELTEFAYQAGLSVEALELGFYHLVGQTIDSYRDQARLKRVAAMIRADKYSRSDIVKVTGFSEDQLETMFIRHFGVPIAQYGQVH